ncbi:MAG: hypothetical protein GWO87_02065 [Xanthomonadaceae bacterium]|nr:hypothetical protein [Rhodospirillaceae bacterium]NIA17953.1 hypothetical protein [Xanthomonadaceae bacterium]
MRISWQKQFLIKEDVQMDLDKVDEMLSRLIDIMDAEGVINDEIVAQLVGEIYDSIVKKYRPLVWAVPHITEKITNDLIPVINAISKVFVIVREDAEFQKIISRSCEVKSKQRFKALKTYQKAGFKRNEAMSLLIQDIANTKAGVQRLAYITKVAQKFSK